jgi:rod shape determining protein RodA
MLYTALEKSKRPTNDQKGNGIMEKRIWKDFNFFLLGCMIVLLSMSLLSVYSATLHAMRADGTPLSILFPRHIINILVGIGAMIVMAIPDYRQFSGLAVPIYIGTLLVLAFVLVVGNITSGAQSWIAFGTRTFQPSEFSKLLIIMVMAAYYSRYTDQQRETWKIQLGGMLLMGGPLLLVFIQPDLGTAIIFGAIWLAMAWAAGLRWHQLSLILVLALPMMVVGWLFVLNEEQRARLSTFYWLFTDPSKVDPNEGYNIIQSLNAISSGGLFGTGLTRGLLSQGNYIPVQYSDFIFAVISEEMGFVGGVVLIVLLALFLWLTLSIAERARDAFGKFLVVGIFGMLLTHVLVNIGVAMSILPVTGIPLPFVSYGGSFTVMIMMSVGLLENVAMRWRKIVF